MGDNKVQDNVSSNTFKNVDAAVQVEEEVSQELDSVENILQQKVEEYKDLYLRSQAEIENIMQRTKREIANIRKLAGESLLTDLLPVVDSMMRGMGAAKNACSPEAETFLEGMQMTLDMVHQFFEKHDVEVLEPEVGAPFNPDSHEAVSSVQNAEAEKNTVSECVQVGFRLNNKVLRPAMVVVFV